MADMAQLVARCADNAKVSGSSPDIRKWFFGFNSFDIKFKGGLNF